MSRHRRTGLLACLVAAALAVGSPAAVAEPTGWTQTGSTYASTTTNVVPVELLAYTAGWQTAVFVADNAVWAVNRVPGGAWGAPTKLSASNVVNGSVAAAGNAEGDGFVAWQSVENGAPALRTTRRSNGGAWSPAALLTAPNVDADPAVSVDPQGTVHLAYIDSDGGVDRAYGTSAQASGGAFQTPHDIGPVNVADVDVASSGSGTTTYVVAGLDGGGGTVDVAYYSTRGGAGWSTATNLRTVSGATTRGLDIEVSHDDSALTWVERHSNTDYRVSGGVRASGDAWSTQLELSGAVTQYPAPTALPTSSGGALLTWSHATGQGDERELRLAAGSATGWEPLGTASTGHNDIEPSFALSEDGSTAVIGWIRIEDGTFNAYARTLAMSQGLPFGPELPLGGSVGTSFAVAANRDIYAVRAWGGSGANRLFGTVLDRHAPTAARVTGPGSISLGSTAPVGWTATDAWSRPLRFDVTVRSAGVGGVFGGTSTWRAATTATSGAYPVATGRTYCFATRPRDSVGNVGGFSGQRCTTTPVDDRSFTGAGWRAVSGSAYYKGTAKQARKRGKTLSLGNVRARTITVYASRGKKLGRMAVRLGGTTVAVLNTKGAAATRTAYVVRLPSARTGTLQLKKLGKKKVVRVDAVVTSPF